MAERLLPGPRDQAALLSPPSLPSSEKPAAQFMAIFGPYAQRADEIIDALSRHDPALAARAAAEAGDTDAGLVLRPEERTS